MNCKPGDMAIIIRSRSGINTGKVVTCLRIADAVQNNLTPSAGPWWEIDRTIQHRWSVSGRLQDRPFASDKNLMPINPLNDEQTTRETEVTP
jgi:hypothetical protein